MTDSLRLTGTETERAYARDVLSTPPGMAYIAGSGTARRSLERGLQILRTKSSAAAIPQAEVA